ncbi:hypothetical protein [Corynebacterium argentoratense]|uniref:hypothetical protein n=1 Tax=Corynebacterium argentoratense TaxID=42817 RepID=UPI0028E840C5|nr:hypothetical protein [Corynebacterium argentoratense]
MSQNTVWYRVRHVDHRTAQRRPHHDWKDTADSATPTAAHTAGTKQSEQQAGRAGGFLGAVKRAGNVLPDPSWLFVILIPLGATAFKAVGRSPVVGAMVAFAASSAGSCSSLPGTD